MPATWISAGSSIPMTLLLIDRRHLRNIFSGNFRNTNLNEIIDTCCRKYFSHETPQADTMAAAAISASAPFNRCKLIRSFDDLKLKVIVHHVQLFIQVLLWSTFLASSQFDLGSLFHSVLMNNSLSFRAVFVVFPIFLFFSFFFSFRIHFIPFSFFSLFHSDFVLFLWTF